jgi:hypothetical protein
MRLTARCVSDVHDTIPDHPAQRPRASAERPAPRQLQGQACAARRIRVRSRPTRTSPADPAGGSRRRAARGPSCAGTAFRLRGARAAGARAGGKAPFHIMKAASMPRHALSTHTICLLSTHTICLLSTHTICLRGGAAAGARRGNVSRLYDTAASSAFDAPCLRGARRLSGSERAPHRRNASGFIAV